MSEIVTGINAAFNRINFHKVSPVFELTSVHETATQVIARFRIHDVVEWESLLVFILSRKATHVRGVLNVGTDYVLSDAKLFYAWTFTLYNEVSMDEAVKDFINLLISYVPADTGEPAKQLEPAGPAVDVKVDVAVSAIKALLSNRTQPVPHAVAPTAPTDEPKKQLIGKTPHVSSENLVSRLEQATPPGGLVIPVSVGTRGKFGRSERLTASRNPTLPVVENE